MPFVRNWDYDKYFNYNFLRTQIVNFTCKASSCSIFRWLTSWKILIGNYSGLTFKLTNIDPLPILPIYPEFPIPAQNIYYLSLNNFHLRTGKIDHKTLKMNTSQLFNLMWLYFPRTITLYWLEGDFLKPLNLISPLKKLSHSTFP